jgi:uncharacterized glyoxalase superfamily protein PhnB
MAKKKNPKKAKPARAKASTRKPARRSAKKPARAKAAASGLRLASEATSLTVNDLARSMTWYCDILGFTVKQRWEHDGEFTGAELHAGNAVLYIGRDDWKMGRDRIKGQGVRIYFYTNQDIDALAAGIKARGGTLASEPKDEYGMRAFNLEDPTGYRITVASNR